MKRKVMIRNRAGKPVQADLIRRLRLKGFESCNLALVLARSQTTVTELSTGAQIAWEFGDSKEAERDAIKTAREKLTKNGVERFEAGVKQLLDKFGEVLNA